MELKTIPPDLLVNNGRLVEKPLKAEGRSTDKDSAAIKKAAREFEALFASMMLKSMRDTVGKDKLTGGGQGEEIYRSMLDQEYANAIASQGSLGLAKSIEQQVQQTRKPGESR